MQHHKVESSNIASVAWKQGVLHVKFKHGGTYEYLGVSEDQFNELKDSTSVGRHLNCMNIKGHKVTEEQA